MSLLAERYELHEVLGRGATGEVRAARDTLTGASVAVKLLRGVDPHDATRVWREVATHRRLRIPGVVRLLDEGTVGAVTFLVMERAEGTPFPGRDGHPTPWADIAGCTLGLVETLGRVHDAGVVHRDLKPANVLVDASGRATVLDFGIARALVERRSGAVEHTEGTPAYLAPEQLSGDVVTARADLFSLGVMLYEALTGALPFEGVDAHTTMLSRLVYTPPPPREVCPEVPERISSLVMRLLARRPDERPRSAWEVATLLRGENAVARVGAGRPWFGRRDAVDALVAAARERRSIDLVGPAGSGRSRCLREAEAALESAGHRCIATRHGHGPFESIDALLDELTGHDDLSLSAMTDVVEHALAAALAEGVTLLVDDVELIDASSRGVIERCRGLGAVLCTIRDEAPTTGDERVALAPWELAEIAALVAGHDRLFHLPSDVAAALAARTGAWPGRVISELDAWARAGLAQWSSHQVLVPRESLDVLADMVPGVANSGARPSVVSGLTAARHDGIDLLAWVELAGPHARPALLASAMATPRWRIDATARALIDQRALEALPDERLVARTPNASLASWSDAARRAAHGRLVALLEPGDDRRLGHLLASLDEAHPCPAEAVVDESVACAQRRAMQGRLGAAASVLAEGMLTLLRLRAVQQGAPWEQQAVRLLSAWMVVAIAEASPQGIDRVIYERRRSDLRDAEALALESLGRAALALEGDTRRALDLASSLRFEDPSLERCRNGIRVQAVRACPLEDAERLLAELAAEAETQTDARFQQAYIGWLGRLRYWQGDFAEAAALHEAAAAHEPWVADRIAALRSAASARMEAFELDRACDLAEQARALAARHRLAHLEARAEWSLRCARFRRREALEPERSLVEAAESLGVVDIEALITSLEAAVAWHKGDHALAITFARRAHGLWQQIGRTDNAMLVRCLLFSMNEALDLFDQTSLGTWILSCRVPGFGIQALALVSVGVGRRWMSGVGNVDWSHEVERLTLQIKPAHHGVRLDVLSVNESVNLWRRVVEGVE